MMSEDRVAWRYHTDDDSTVIGPEVKLPILSHGLHELESTNHALEQ